VPAKGTHNENQPTAGQGVPPGIDRGMQSVVVVPWGQADGEARTCRVMTHASSSTQLPTAQGYECGIGEERGYVSSPSPTWSTSTPIR